MCVKMLGMCADVRRLLSIHAALDKSISNAYKHACADLALPSSALRTGTICAWRTQGAAQL